MIRVLDNDFDPDNQLDPSTLRLSWHTPGADSEERWTGRTTARFVYTPDGSVSEKLFEYAVQTMGRANPTPALAQSQHNTESRCPRQLHDERGHQLIVPAPGVFANDEAGGTPLLSTPAAHGTVTLNPDGSFSYMPTADFNGTDTFSYTGKDGDEAAVTIAVNAGRATRRKSCVNTPQCPTSYAWESSRSTTASTLSRASRHSSEGSSSTPNAIRAR